MPDAAELADKTMSRDPETGLQAIRALRQLLERLEELQVANARAQGWTWEQIARELGVSKQAAHKKHAGPKHVLENVHAALMAGLRQQGRRKE